ncbi:MAG: hypothetical protein JSR91_21280 [Proteobacteria bacterium]|nr:hypothetical protein [Pseudomonadota bacterium]
MKRIAWLVARPLLVVLSIPLVDAVYLATPMSIDLSSLLVEALLAVVWAGIAFGGAVLCVIAVRKRKWRVALSWLVVPVLITMGFLNLPYVTSSTFISGSALRFAILLPQFRADLARERRTDEPALRVWNRGGMIWHSSGIVYDESDEVALPPGQQSAAWQKRARQSEFACEGFHVVPLFGHFYIADFPC